MSNSSARRSTEKEGFYKKKRDFLLNGSDVIFTPEDPGAL